LLGPNGAGKTTLVRVLSTLLKPDEGRALVGGRDVVSQPESVRKIIGLAGQYAAVDETLTGRENLEMVGRLYRLSASDARRRADEALERLGLTEAAHRLVRTYSGGMRRRLDLGASLTGRPKVLILDEPTTGLDPRTRLDLWDFIRELVSQGTTVLLTTQYLEEADHLADHIVVVDRGRVIARGTSDELKAQLGSDVIEVRADNPEDLQRIVDLLVRLGTEAPRVDPIERRVTVPVSRGVQDLMAAVRLLDEARITPSDLGLRRPSLDDVFLALTGHTAAESDSQSGDQQAASAKRGRSRTTGRSAA
jgi:ABC-2 type transport system ATP-binding protein